MQTADSIAVNVHTPNLRAALAALPGFDEEPATGPDSAPVAPEADNEGPFAEELAATVATTAAAPAVTVATTAATPAHAAVRPRSRTWLYVLGGVACAVAVAYGAGALFFSSHFMPFTTVNGEDVSWMATEELAESVTRVGLSYETHIAGDGMDLTVPGTDIGVSYDGSAYAQQAAEQVEWWAWPVELAKEHNLAVSEGISFDAGRLAELVGAAVDQLNADATQPTDATLGFSEEERRFVVVPEALGTAVDRDAAIAAASSAVASLQEEVQVGERELVQPSVTSDDEALVAAVGTANRFVDEPLTLHMPEDVTETVTPELLRSWVGLNPEDRSLSVDRDAVLAWGHGDLSDRYDTVGKTRRYTRSDGKEVEVTGGDYGWCIDSDALADQICERLSSGSSEAIEVPMKSAAAKVADGAADWPQRYIDVDISEQHMRVYGEDGQQVMESDVVTGIPNHATDQGVYTIFEHTAGTTLVGPDYDGDNQPDYRTWVNYWMPFNGGMGLHDAYWRGAFGGNIYKGNGSHGCVNLPSDVAERLFDWAQVGDVVVVHY